MNIYLHFNQTTVRKLHPMEFAMNNTQIRKLTFSIGLIILILVTTSSYLHIKLGGGSAPSIHALCPFGALESLYYLATEGAFIKKILSATMVLFVGSIVLALIFRRAFCGIICPFRTLQMLFSTLRKPIMKKRLIIPSEIDKPLRNLKYFVLILTVAMSWITASLWMSPYDPWTAYSHLSAGTELFEEYLIGFIILIIVLIASFFVDMFFCKYLCPMGALLAIISKLSPHKITRTDKCINCKLCTKICPVNIKVSEISEVKSVECVNCQSCLLVCPVEGALVLTEGKRKMKSLQYILLTLIIFFGIILISKSSGLYQDIPEIPSEGDIKNIEQVDEGIKGYMTLKEISLSTGLSLDNIYAKGNFSKDNVPPDTKLKDISSKLGREVTPEDIREIIKALMVEK